MARQWVNSARFGVIASLTLAPSWPYTKARQPSTMRG
jgi:hypothetical protein